ncbi:hypothetical protein TeGR_g4087 [Tetraparma gracilis]|uniref:Pseudouridine synthase n=1 Tax=Tetraparma gracilis TaxID=2962635 RepID=A0ABQ6MFC0_9STRA|nr:hypothetical protein TeGR_g4087 [Tetraparma gracilis]
MGGEVVGEVELVRREDARGVGHFNCLSEAAARGEKVGGDRADVFWDEGTMGEWEGRMPPVAGGGETLTRARVRVGEGKKRMVRRMFQAVGLHVLDLVRVSYGEIELGDLQPGEIRPCTEKEAAWARKLLD